jgi:hypothetical protein
MGLTRLRGMAADIPTVPDIWFNTFLFTEQYIQLEGLSSRKGALQRVDGGLLLHTTSRFVPFLPGSLPRYIVKMGR